MRTAAIIVAAGRGTRMGGARSKIALPIAGLAMLTRVVRAFASHPAINDVIVVGDPREVEEILGAETAAGVTIVPGGERRQDSVRAGLDRIGEAEMVLVHDAARPLVPADVIGRVLGEAARSGAAIPGVPIDDTVKRIAPDGAVRETVPREGLICAQTPQGFRADLLRTAFAKAGEDQFVATDEASLIEHAGGRVTVVPGVATNIKITRPGDLLLAEAIARVTSSGSDDV